MNPIALVGPAVEPIPLAEMKAYLRLDGAEEDDLVGTLVAAARVTIERQTRSCLIEQSWRYALGGWPGDRRVRLPLHPIRAVEAVRVSRDIGSPTVLASGLYRLEAGGDVACLVVDREAHEAAGAWPRIEIDLTCGFGADAEAVPEPLRLAIRRLVAWWFEHRGDERQSGPPGLPSDVAALIAPFTRARLT